MINNIQEDILDFLTSRNTDTLILDYLELLFQCILGRKFSENLQCFLEFRI